MLGGGGRRGTPNPPEIDDEVVFTELPNALPSRSKEDVAVVLLLWVALDLPGIDIEKVWPSLRV